MNNHFNKNSSNMESFYIDFGTSRVWFQADETGVTTCGRRTRLSTDKLSEFIAIAKVLGFKAGRL